MAMCPSSRAEAAHPVMAQDPAKPPLILVLGGARSGKSRFAETWAEAQGGRFVYIATARAEDAEMAARIAEHQARRGKTWRTVEAPLDLAAALAQECRPGQTVLVDCLTLWLSNLMAADVDVDQAVQGLLDVLPPLQAPVVIVSNEVGLGIVPMNDLARVFRDHQGRLNQRVAAAADSVVFMAAGLPLYLKGAD